MKASQLLLGFLVASAFAPLSFSQSYVSVTVKRADGQPTRKPELEGLRAVVWQHRSCGIEQTSSADKLPVCLPVLG
jgi:hypothetical protein